jgi:hypothetical protein
VIVVWLCVSLPVQVVCFPFWLFYQFHPVLCVSYINFVYVLSCFRLPFRVMASCGLFAGHTYGRPCFSCFLVVYLVVYLFSRCGLCLKLFSCYFSVISSSFHRHFRCFFVFWYRSRCRYLGMDRLQREAVIARGGWVVVGVWRSK